MMLKIFFRSLFRSLFRNLFRSRYSAIIYRKFIGSLSEVYTIPISFTAFGIILVLRQM